MRFINIVQVMRFINTVQAMWFINIVQAMRFINTDCFRYDSTITTRPCLSLMDSTVWVIQSINMIASIHKLHHPNSEVNNRLKLCSIGGYDFAIPTQPCLLSI